MRKAMMAVMALCLAVPAARAQQSGQQAAQRRELEQKMQQLEQQMRDLQRELSRMAPEDARLDAVPRASVFSLFGRAHLGVYFSSDKSPATDSIGVLVQSVTPGGPAEQAGVRSGDIVTTFNGEKLTGEYSAAAEDESAPGIRLRDLAADLSNGDTVKLVYRRGKETRSATIVARDLPTGSWGLAFTAPPARVHVQTGEIADQVRRAQDEAYQAQAEAMRSAMPALVGAWGMYDRWFDMDLVALNPELGDYFGTNTGLLVVHAPEDSTLNLKSGDVILSVDGRTPASQPQLIRILRSYAPGETMHLDIMRHQHRTTVTAKVPERQHVPDDGMDFHWQGNGIMR
jgi:S1-C subfamily serine protease